jgi:uncharacterized membrane protein YgcG
MMVRVGADFSDLIAQSKTASSVSTSWANTTVSAFNKVSGETSDVGGLTTAITGLGTALKRTAGILGITFGVTELISFGSECIEVASDLAEVQNVVDTAFGDMAYKCEDFASTAIENFGMSELAAKQTSSTYMSMATSMGLDTDAASDMSIALAELSGDVASFYNLEQDDSATKLQSVFTGETESLRSLGVVMTQTNLDAYALAKGLGKTTSEMTDAEKVQLRYMYVTEKLGLAQGDFAKTSDSWANQTRILSERFTELKGILGTGLIAVLKPVIKWVNNLLGAFIDLVNTIGSGLSKLFGIEFEEMSGLDSTLDSTDNLDDLSSSVDDITSGLEDADDAMSDLSGSTGDLADATDDLADATDAAAKAQRALLGFDEITKLSSSTTSSGSGSGGSGSGGSGSSGSGSDSSGDSSSGAGATSAIPSTGNALDDAEQAVKDWVNRIQTEIDGIHLPDLVLPSGWGDNVKRQIADITNLDLTVNINQTALSQQLAAINQTQINNIAVTVSLERDWDTVESYVSDHGGGGFGGGGSSGWTLPIGLQLLKNNWDSLTGFVLGKGGNVINATVQLLKDDWKSLKDWIGNNQVIQAGVSLVKSGWTSLTKFVGTSVSAGVSLAKSGWTSVSNFVGTKVSVGIGLVKSGWKSVKSWLGNLTASFNIKLPKVSVTWSGTPIALPHFKVTWNAKGAILNGAQLFGMAGNTLLGGGEAGREAVLPLESNTGWMDKIADKVVSRMGSSEGEQTINVTVTLDRQVVGKTVVKYINGERNRTGKSPVLI